MSFLNKQLYLALSFSLIIAILGCQKKYEQHYKSAYKHLSKGEIQDLETAIDEFDTTILHTMMALHGKANALRALGHKLSQSEMYLKAADAFEKAKVIEPTDLNTYYHLGLCYANYAQIQKNKNQRQKYLKLAEDAYLSGEKLKPNSQIILYALGVLYGFIKEDVKLGIRYLEKSSRLNTRDIKTLFALANLHYQIGNIKPAKDNYLNILNLVESHSEYTLKVKKNLEIIKREYPTY